MAWRTSAALALATLWIAGSAAAAPLCVYQGTQYAPGSLVCQLGGQYRCEQGSWTSLGMRCPEADAIASTSCQLNGANYSAGSAICQFGQRYHCDRGTWVDLRIPCETEVEAKQETLISPELAADTVVATDVDARDGFVKGVLVNRSTKPVRSVRLVVRHAWMWRDERNPGEDSPSRASFFTVDEEIPPRGAVPFAHHSYRPLPIRPDGHFDTSVQVVGFTEIGE